MHKSGYRDSLATSGDPKVMREVWKVITLTAHPWRLLRPDIQARHADARGETEDTILNSLRKTGRGGSLLNHILPSILLCCAFLPAQPIPTAPDKLTVDGDIPAPLTITATDLAKMPRETVSLTDMDGSKTSYEGVALVEILKKAGVPLGKEMRGKALAGYMLAEASDGYQVVFSLGELDPDVGVTRVIVADRRDDQPLSATQGPIRLVVPSDKRPARSVGMVEKLHIVRLRK